MNGKRHPGQRHFTVHFPLQAFVSDEHGTEFYVLPVHVNITADDHGHAAALLSAALEKLVEDITPPASGPYHESTETCTCPGGRDVSDPHFAGCPLFADEEEHERPKRGIRE